MTSTGEIKNAVRLAQQYNINIYKILMNGLGNSSLRVSQLRVELEEYNRSSMKFFDRLYQIRDSKIPFACVREEQIRVFRDQVKRNDKLRQEVHSIQRNLWNMREMGQRVPLANKHLIEQRFPELCVKDRSDRVPLTVLCDQVIRKYNLRHERHIIALLKWAEEESNSRKATSSVTKRNLQRNQIHPTLKPTLSQDQLAFQALAAAYAVTPVNSNEDLSKDSADGFDITLDDIRKLDSKSQTKKRGSATCDESNDDNSLKIEENTALDQQNLSINFKRSYPLFSWEELMLGFKRSPHAQMSENISQTSKTEASEELGSTYTGISSESNTQDLSVTTERQPCEQIKNLFNQPINQKSKHFSISTERKHCDKTSNLPGTTNTQKTKCLPIKTEREHCYENKDLPIQPNTQKSQGLPIKAEREHCGKFKILPCNQANTQKTHTSNIPVKTEQRHFNNHTNLPYQANTQKTQASYIPVKTEQRYSNKPTNLPYQPNTLKTQASYIPVKTEQRHFNNHTNLHFQANTQQTQGSHIPVKTEQRHCNKPKNLPYQANTCAQKSQALSTITDRKHCEEIKRLTTEAMLRPSVVVKSEIQKSQNTIKPVHPLVGSDRPHVYENKIKRTQHSLKRTFTEHMTCTEADQLKKKREKQLRELELKKERMKELLSQQFCKAKTTKSSFHYYKVEDNVQKVRNGSKKSVALAPTQGHSYGVTKDKMHSSLVSRKRKVSPSDILPQSKRSKKESGIVLRKVKNASDWNVKQVFDRE